MKVTIPTDLSEITLGQLQALTKLEGSELNSIEMQKQTIELLTDVERSNIDLFKLTDLNDVYSKLLSLSKRSDNLTQIVTIEGVKYGFHPNLDEMTLGEFVDLDEHCKDGVDSIQQVLAILYRPITEEKGNNYNIEPYNESHIQNARLFENLSIDFANGVMVFFYHLGSELTQTILNYLQKETEKMTTQQKQTLGLNGDGINRSMESLKGMLPSLITLQN